MPRPRKSIPSYLPHKQSGRARAVWTDPAGTRRFRLLPGAFDSPESRSAFAALLLEIDAAPHRLQAADPGLTLAELLLAYLEHAERHYRTPDGKPTSEVYEVKLVVRALRELYADTPVVEFGPLCVKAARLKWVNEGRSRSECNRRVALIKRIVKWAVAEELAPPAVYQAVTAVAGLQKGRTAARETEPVVAVDDAVVDATLPFLGRHARGLVEFQRLTGCRPGEACAVRRCDLDTGGPTWRYRPPHHKTAHRGKARVIAVGPRAQALLRQFFTADAADYLFSPRRAVAEWLVGRAANRRTPRYPVAHGSQRGEAGGGLGAAAGRAVRPGVVRAGHRPGLRQGLPAAGRAGPAGGRDPQGVVGEADAGPAVRGDGVADGAPVAPEPAAPHVRHPGPQAARAGGGPSAARARAGRRDAGLRGTQLASAVVAKIG